MGAQVLVAGLVSTVFLCPHSPFILPRMPDIRSFLVQVRRYRRSGGWFGSLLRQLGWMEVIHAAISMPMEISLPSHPSLHLFMTCDGCWHVLIFIIGHDNTSYLVDDTFHELDIF